MVDLRLDGGADVPTVSRRVIQCLDQCGDVREREAEGLRTLDEQKSLDRPRPVPPVATRRALGFGEEPFALVKAHGLHVAADPFAEQQIRHPHEQGDNRPEVAGRGRVGSARVPGNCGMTK